MRAVRTTGRKGGIPRERERASFASAVQAEEDMVDGGRGERMGAMGESRPYPRPV